MKIGIIDKHTNHYDYYFMKNIDYKVEDGKLLRIQVDIRDNIIKDIKIYGDFFIYPETAIFEIERLLIDKNLNVVANFLDNFIKKENIKIIGFSPKDLQKALNYNIL